MFIDFNSIGSDAKVWIYQASRPFSAEEKSTIDALLRTFTESWDSHGRALRASFALPYDHFIVLAVYGQDAASGCSIDKSVRAIEQVQERTGIAFLDRSQVAYKDKQGSIEVAPLGEIGKLVAQGILQTDTIIFNNSVSTYSEYAAGWEVTAGDSWMKRYFKKHSASNTL
jgi:hypothetical protein